MEVSYHWLSKIAEYINLGMRVLRMRVIASEEAILAIAKVKGTRGTVTYDRVGWHL